MIIVLIHLKTRNYGVYKKEIVKFDVEAQLAGVDGREQGQTGEIVGPR